LAINYFAIKLQCPRLLRQGNKGPQGTAQQHQGQTMQLPHRSLWTKGPAWLGQWWFSKKHWEERSTRNGMVRIVRTWPKWHNCGSFETTFNLKIANYWFEKIDNWNKSADNLRKRKQFKILYYKTISPPTASKTSTKAPDKTLDLCFLPSDN